MSKQELRYMHGFGNEFSSECSEYPGAIPQGVTNPQFVKYGLFAEQISGSAFTAPRASNKRSWFYRAVPSVLHSPFQERSLISMSPNFEVTNYKIDPNQKRWSPFEPLPNMQPRDFIDGMQTIAFSDRKTSESIAIHIYLAEINSRRRSFVNSDGDFLIVPQKGSLSIRTEFGEMFVEPNEICVIQQGMKFSVSSPSLSFQQKEKTFIRGYILEVKGNHFELPYLGPIGANGLANQRDFEIPVASMEPTVMEGDYEIVQKFRNKIFYATQNWSPYNVAAWFGNYTPYKYNLDKFVSVNSVSVDHPDPSIFTVLTCPSIGKPGTALADFVIFPPRWECANDTFRPPYYHRNCMTEFMGLIKGNYQAKSSAFSPGGATLHQSMIPHGPDTECFTKAITADNTKPSRVADGTMAFMFETYLSLDLIESDIVNKAEDKNYHECWSGLVGAAAKAMLSHTRFRQQRPSK